MSRTLADIMMYVLLIGIGILIGYQVRGEAEEAKPGPMTTSDAIEALVTEWPSNMVKIVVSRYDKTYDYTIERVER